MMNNSNPSSELIFYSNPQSRGQVVQWMLYECDADYQSRIIEFNEVKSNDYLAINPMGKLPALQDGEVVITETLAICTYLADRYADKGLAPAINSPERGSYYRWLFFISNVIEPIMMEKMGLLTRDTANHAVKEVQKTLGFGKLEQVLQILAQTLTKQPYLCGDKFSTADLCLVAYINWAKFSGAIDTLPQPLEEYCQRIAQRPAFQKVWGR